MSKSRQKFISIIEWSHEFNLINWIKLILILILIKIRGRAFNLCIFAASHYWLYRLVVDRNKLAVFKRLLSSPHR
jgi:hypothetical protein